MDLLNLVTDKSLVKTDAYINGAFVKSSSGKTFDVTNPYDGAVIAKVSDCGADMMAQAIDSAQIAQKKWAAKTAKERAIILRKW